MAHSKTLIFCITIGLLLVAHNPGVSQAAIGSTSSAQFSCSSSRTSVENSGAANVASGPLTLFIGYRQVSGNNQNPIMAAFNGNTQVWCRQDYDTSPADSRGYGLVSVAGNIYATFTADGGNVTLTNFTGDGWINSYGSGGGPRVSVVLRIDPNTGEPYGGTFIIAKLNSGNTNSATVDAITPSGGHVAISGVSAFGPLDTSRNRRNDCTENEFTYVLSTDLSRIISAGCTGGSTLFAGNIAPSLADVDNSGRVTPADVIFVINRIGENVNTGDNGAADVNNDNVISTADVSIVINSLGTNAP
ncbi:MAG: dockerin type I domain-containing protein [Chloroflexota bacterium]